MKPVADNPLLVGSFQDCMVGGAFLFCNNNLTSHTSPVRGQIPTRSISETRWVAACDLCRPQRSGDPPVTRSNALHHKSAGKITFKRVLRFGYTATAIVTVSVAAV